MLAWSAAMELTDIKADNLDRQVVEQQVSQAWPDGVLYHGASIFGLAYVSGEVENACREKGLPDECQECFLGYQPSTDRFLMGFDVWPGEEEYLPSAYWFSMDADTGKASNFEPLRGLDNLFYKSYPELQQKHPDLIGVRLD
tara:strand:+ start:329 stop:754 length:426 start_codon:yes stop_codon:yes gene_type:complete